MQDRTPELNLYAIEKIAYILPRVADLLDRGRISNTTTYGGDRIADLVQITSGKRIYHINVAT